MLFFSEIFICFFSLLSSVFTRCKCNYYFFSTKVFVEYFYLLLFSNQFQQLRQLLEFSFLAGYHWERLKARNTILPFQGAMGGDVPFYPNAMRWAGTFRAFSPSEFNIIKLCH